MFLLTDIYSDRYLISSNRFNYLDDGCISVNNIRYNSHLCNIYELDSIPEEYRNIKYCYNPEYGWFKYINVRY